MTRIGVYERGLWLEWIRRSMQKDIALKQLAEHEDVFAEVFNQLAFGGKNIITSSELTAIPTEAKEGIGALIKLCKDFQVSRQDTLQKILENFSLPQQTAEEYLAMYW